MVLAEIKNKHILFRALDWGMGHTTRSLSILKQLSEQENTFHIIGNEAQIQLFKEYGLIFTETIVPKNSWDFQKRKTRFGMAISLFLEVKKMIQLNKSLIENHLEMQTFDIVLSDHCYGFFNFKKPSYFISHQLLLPPKTPWVAKQFHRHWLSNFNHFFIIDEISQPIVPELHNNKKVSKELIGLRSRFDVNETNASTRRELLFVISGPDVFAKHFLEKIQKLENTRILRIICPKHLQIESGNFLYSNSQKEADDWFLNASTIVSRSGYSTIMDCLVLNKKAILLATKNQLEQEYLAEKQWKMFQIFKSKNEVAFWEQVKKELKKDKF